MFYLAGILRTQAEESGISKWPWEEGSSEAGKGGKAI